MTNLDTNLNTLKTAVSFEICGDDSDAEFLKATETAETMEDFYARNYTSKSVETHNGLEMVILLDYQAQKGDARKTLYIADFGDKRGVIVS